MKNKDFGSKFYIFSSNCTHRQVAELKNHVIRIIRVSNGIGPTQQHLEGHVRYHLPHVLQSFPGALVQKPEGHVERRTPPVLHGVQLTEVVRYKRTDFQQVVSAHPGGQQRLMGVSERGVHKEEALVISDGLRERLGALLLVDLPETPGRLDTYRRCVFRSEWDIHRQSGF